jgi:hypothetical protein
VQTPLFTPPAVRLSPHKKQQIACHGQISALAGGAEHFRLNNNHSTHKIFAFDDKSGCLVR